MNEYKHMGFETELLSDCWLTESPLQASEYMQDPLMQLLLHMVGFSLSANKLALACANMVVFSIIFNPPPPNALSRTADGDPL